MITLILSEWDDVYYTKIPDELLNEFLPFVQNQIIAVGGEPVKSLSYYDPKDVLKVLIPNYPTKNYPDVISSNPNPIMATGTFTIPLTDKEIDKNKIIVMKIKELIAKL